MYRFEWISDDVEPVDEYRRGGYHPVHLQDVFNQQYQVLAKLAYGQYSFYCVARKRQKVSMFLLPSSRRPKLINSLSRLKRHVVLKILKSDTSRHNKELAILLRLSDPSIKHPGQNHVVQLLDHFEHKGPNGTHLCLVFPMLISDGQAMCVRKKPRHADYVKAISKQILLGLDFLHEQSIIHTDLQPANILFSADNATINDIQLQPPTFSSVKWLPGIEIDDSAPQYLVVSQRPRGILDSVDYRRLSVRIGDLGGAVWSGQQQDSRPVTPRGLRPPELIEGKPWDGRIDIWTTACLVSQLATNEPLFPLGIFGCTDKEIDESLMSQISDLTERETQHEALTTYLSERLPSDFGTGSIKELASFLSLMLKPNPQDRRTTAELLNDPFLCS